MGIFRKAALLSVAAVLILSAISCRPDRPWAAADAGPAVFDDNTPGGSYTNLKEIKNAAH